MDFEMLLAFAGVYVLLIANLVMTLKANAKGE
jgi:hypothetical protein